MKTPSLLLRCSLAVITAASAVSAVASNLAGQVLDDAGSPVSHIWVLAHETWQGLEEETLTDAEGRFELSLSGGTWQFVGDNQELDLLGFFPNPLALVLTNSEMRTNLVWTLRRANAHLHGRALDDAGAPVPYTWIYVYGGAQYFGRQAWTDADGEFDVDLVGGAWDLRNGDDLSALHLFAPQTTVQLADGETRSDFVWVLRRANARLLGQVVDEAGTPLSRVRVAAYESSQGLSCKALTDADGWVDLPLVEGAWQLDWDQTILAEFNLFSSPTTVTLTHGETRTNLWVLRRANAHLHGQLVDDAGRPVSHIWVSGSENRQRLERRVLADAEGRFDFELVGGVWQFHLNEQKTSLLSLFIPPMTIVLTNGETRTNLVWVLPRAQAPGLHGRVEDDKGVPLGYLRIVASEQIQGLEREGITDTDGQYDLELVSGIWQIRGDSQQLALHGLFAPSLEVDLRQGQTRTNVIWKLARANTHLRGQVLDDAGTPVSRMPVSFYDWQQGFARTGQTDVAGWFEVNLVGGTWQLREDSARLAALNLLAPFMEVALTNGEPQTNLVWRMQRASARLGGRVVDDAGASVGCAWLGAYERQQGLARSLQSSADGCFEFALVQGTWEIQFYPSTQDSVLFGSNLVVAVTNSQVTTNFTYLVWRAPWRLAGVVRDTLDKPLSGVGVEAWSMNGSRSTCTDDNGCYQLPALDGDWSVYLSTSDLELHGCETPLNRSATVSGADVVLDFTAVAMPTAASLDLVGFDLQRSLRLRVTGRPGFTYQLQTSTNLIDWAEVRSLTMPSVGGSDLRDTQATHLLRRFYRVLGE